MKRMRIVGLCLAAVFALSALVASSASAAGPEFKVCGKAAKSGKLYTGKYTDKACSKEASPAEITEGKKNKYERVSWEKAKKKKFKGKNKGSPHNNIVNPFGEKSGGGKEPAKIEGTTTCTKEAVNGEVTGPKEEKWKTVFTGCEALSTPCNTAGAKSGEIKTQELEGTLVYLSKDHTKVGIQVKGLGPEGELAQYECLNKGLNVVVTGQIIAETTGNINIANKKTITGAKEGPLRMQSTMYAEEAFTEENGKEFFEYEFSLGACIKGESPFPKGLSKAECEAILAAKAPKETQPVSLISTVSGAQNATAPAVQNGETESKGESFLIEAK